MPRSFAVLTNTIPENRSEEALCSGFMNDKNSDSTNYVFQVLSYPGFEKEQDWLINILKLLACGMICCRKG
jgi:hypothetical protein